MQPSEMTVQLFDSTGMLLCVVPVILKVGQGLPQSIVCQGKVFIKGQYTYGTYWETTSITIPQREDLSLEDLLVNE